MIVAIAGPDAAGKTSVCNALVRHFESAKPYSLSIKQVSTIDILRSFTTPEEFFQSSPGFRLDVLSRCCQTISDSDADGSVVFADSYWMKHFASEVAIGATPGEVTRRAAAFVSPIKTFYLRVDASTSWVRRTVDEVNVYECGLTGEVSRAAFMEHQERLGSCLDTWASQYDWDLVDASRDFDSTLSDVIKTCDNTFSVWSRDR